jgi:beta-lactamase regulating signal transducer with metallopeptidase domain
MRAFFAGLMVLPGDIAAGAARLTAGALVAGLWQGLLLCAATGIILKAAPKSTARMRFVVWSAVFCASAAMPFVNLVAALSAGQQAVATGLHWVFDPRWSYMLAAVWLLASVYRAAELSIQGIGLRALWKSAVPIKDETLRRLDVAGRNAEVCTSTEVDRPSVIGFLAPRILIPEWLFVQLNATELHHIVLHEMEHLRRRDDWVNLLQKIGLVLLPLHPALFWIDRRLSTERELACDDAVLERTHTPKAYAASLTSVAERRLEVRRASRMSALALAATGLKRRGSELGQRIERILDPRPSVNPGVAGGVAALLVVGVLGLAASLVRAPQLVSFGARNGAQQVRTSNDAALTTPDISSRPASALPKGQMLPTIGFENVVFHAPVSRTAKVRATVRRSAAGSERQQISGSHISALSALAPAGAQRLVVLTSWDEVPVSRVVISAPDGRFFVAPYAAVPTQAGWLLVQL